MTKLVSILILLLTALPGWSQFVPPGGGGNLQVSWTPKSYQLGNDIGYELFGSPLTTLEFDYKTNAVGFGLINCGNLKTISLPNCTQINPTDANASGIAVAVCFALVKFSAPKLQSVAGLIQFEEDPALITIDFPALTNYGTPASNPFTIQICNALTNLSFPNLVSAQPNLDWSQDPDLVNISIPKYVPSNGAEDSYLGDSLTASAIDSLLSRYVANADFVSGSIDISGGGNATPDAAGMDMISTLEDRGVTVTTN